MQADTSTIPVRTEARRMVTASLRRSGLVRRYEQLVEADLSIADAACRVAWYLSLKIRHPHGRRPLLHQCLADAVMAASDDHPDSTTRLDHFIDAAVAHMTLLLRYRISRGDAIWDPLYGPPLMEWFRHGDFEIQRNSDDVSGMVAIASYKAVLAGRLRGHEAKVIPHEGALA